MIALFAEDTSVQSILPKQKRYSSRPLLLGEPFFGAFKSGRPKENTARTENFAIANTVFASDIDTSREHGRIKDLLHKKGHPIPENDIWIAALAIEHGD